MIGGGFFAGAIETLKSPLMRRIALLMLLGDAVGTVIYALLADYSGATYPTREARINFAAGIDLYANSLQMILQLVLTRPLMVRFGPAAAMAMDGALKAIMLAGLVVFGGGWIAIVAIITRASAYGVFKPAADSLYTRVDAETRYKTKNFIDTVGLALRRCRRHERVQPAALARRDGAGLCGALDDRGGKLGLDGLAHHAHAGTGFGQRIARADVTWFPRAPEPIARSLLRRTRR